MRLLQFIGILLLVFQGFAQSEGIPSQFNPPRLVSNFSKAFPNLINDSEQETLERKLLQFKDSTSNEIAVVIVDDLAGMDANTFATELLIEWGVGKKDLNNGVVLLVKPTEENGGRKVYIAVGYGLEPVIPDAVAKRIVENELIPNFKAENYYQGIDAAVDVLMGLAKGEFDHQSYGYNYDQREGNIWLTIIIIVIILLIIFRRRKGGGGGGGRTYYSGGSFGGYSGGGSSFSGGGGFGGFGGGSSGGGGAGGSW
ncbi:MAG: TPM domain-containing protein [Bacteroidetes bacterium]|nr:MAG: TPM domain-containing protein [Bacteroidota bacterium]